MKRYCKQWRAFTSTSAKQCQRHQYVSFGHSPSAKQRPKPKQQYCINWCPGTHSKEYFQCSNYPNSNTVLTDSLERIVTDVVNATTGNKFQWIVLVSYFKKHMKIDFLERTILSPTVHNRSTTLEAPTKQKPRMVAQTTRGHPCLSISIIFSIMFSVIYMITYL